MHEDPQIPNFGDPGKGPELEIGMVLAIEPMVNAGGADVRMGSDGWAVYSQDDSLAAHFEFTVAVTDGRPSHPHPLAPGLTQSGPRRGLPQADAFRRLLALAGRAPARAAFGRLPLVVR